MRVEFFSTADDAYGNGHGPSNLETNYTIGLLVLPRPSYKR